MFFSKVIGWSRLNACALRASICSAGKSVSRLSAAVRTESGHDLTILQFPAIERGVVVQILPNVAPSARVRRTSHLTSFVDQVAPYEYWATRSMVHAGCQCGRSALRPALKGKDIPAAIVSSYIGG